jgi:hypothetical protein
LAIALMMLPLASPPEALASRLGREEGDVLRYTAERDERVSFSAYTFSSRLTFSLGIPEVDLAPASRCVREVLSSVYLHCERPVTLVVVGLSDLDDEVRLTLEDIPTVVGAGGGSDVVGTGTGPDQLRGEGGDDFLKSDDSVLGSAADLLDGGAGDDTLRGGHGADDHLGGPGEDWADFRDHAADRPVTVTLNDVADDGAAGEGDNVRADVENLQGGWGADRLVGDDRPNQLRGAPGNDDLTGGGGRDILRGEDGDDTIHAQDGVGEDVFCGAGNDTARLDTADRVPDQDCERVIRSRLLEPDADGDGFPVPIDCDDANPGIRPGASDLADNGVDEDCSGADVIDLDRDDDGFNRPSDCDDGDGSIRPGAREVPGNQVDENCNGRVDPYPRVTGDITARWAVSRGYARVVSLKVSRLRAPATIEVRCAGRRCRVPKTRIGVRRARRSVDVTRFVRGRRLRIGTVLEVRLLRPGMQGKVVRYRVRGGRRPPAVSQLCLVPGSRRPSRC